MIFLAALIACESVEAKTARQPKGWYCFSYHRPRQQGPGSSSSCERSRDDCLKSFLRWKSYDWYREKYGELIADGPVCGYAKVAYTWEMTTLLPDGSLSKVESAYVSMSECKEETSFQTKDNSKATVTRACSATN